MRNAVGEGPVSFFNDQGRLVVYDLSLIKFDGDDPKLDGQPEDPKLTTWLKTLVKQGRLAPIPAVIPPPVEVLQLSAAQAGDLDITFDVLDGGATDKVEVVVTWTDAYAGLKLADLPTKLGATPTSRVGLVELSGPVGTKPPVTNPAVPQIITAGAGGAPDTASWELEDEDGNVAFTLVPRTGVDIDNAKLIKLSVAVDPASPPADPTFTLKAVWQSAPIENVTSGHLGDIVQPSAFAVDVVVPAGIGNALPVIGKVKLAGGAETVAAKKATASIVAQ